MRRQKLVALQVLRSWIMHLLPVKVHLHHVIDCSTPVHLRIALPSTGPRSRKVVNDARTILSRREHVPHARLVHIKSTKLRYLSFVLLPLVKLYMLRRTLNVPLQCLTLLRLWRVRHGHMLGQLQWKTLLHAIARGNHLLIRGELLNSRVKLLLLLMLM